MQNKKRQPNGSCGDLFFLGAVIALALIGVLFVYSASYYNAEVQYGDGAYFVKKQIIGLILGCISMVVISRFDCERWKKIGFPAYIVSLILLALVFVPGIGKSNYGATRWIGFGSFTIQPSELAKYAFVLYTAGVFAKAPERMRTFRGIAPVLVAGLSICILIMLEPNMSVTVCMGAIMMGMIFLGGASFQTIGLICIPIFIAIPVLIVVEPYRLQRLSAFLNPWASTQGEGYQLIQSFYALANGNWFGVGLFRSRQKYRFLPFSESDFILSVIAEEVGFFGVILLFLLIGFIIWRGFRIAKQCNTFYSYMLVLGIMLAFAIQASLNALVVSGCIPPTGLPLPLVSAGNTSLVVTMSGMGIVYGVSRRQNTQSRFKIHKI